MTEIISILSLGQTGFMFESNNNKFIIDPYLSDYVEDKYGEKLKRQSPIVVEPELLFDIDIILITHEHEDHCDPNTLRKIVKANPNVLICCPIQCNEIIRGIPFTQVINPKVNETLTIGKVNIRAIPSSHLEVEIKNNYSRWLGYELKIGDKILYHPGDTIPYDGLKNYLSDSIDLAFLPINERNYYRERDGIIGNMSSREAIDLSRELHIKEWIPTHWDMFEVNSTTKEEFELIANFKGCKNYVWIKAGERFELEVNKC